MSMAMNFSPLQTHTSRQSSSFAVPPEGHGCAESCELSAACQLESTGHSVRQTRIETSRCGECCWWRCVRYRRRWGGNLGWRYTVDAAPPQYDFRKQYI